MMLENVMYIFSYHVHEILITCVLFSVAQEKCGLF